MVLCSLDFCYEALNRFGVDRTGVDIHGGTGLQRVRDNQPNDEGERSEHLEIAQRLEPKCGEVFEIGGNGIVLPFFCSQLSCGMGANLCVVCRVASGCVWSRRCQTRPLCPALSITSRNAWVVGRRSAGWRFATATNPCRNYGHHRPMRARRPHPMQRRLLWPARLRSYLAGFHCDLLS